MDCVKIWAELQDIIKNAIDHEVSYSIHIKRANAVAYDGSTFIISVPTSINKNIIEFKFKDIIENVLEAHIGQKLTLKIILESDRAEYITESEAVSETPELKSAVPVQIKPQNHSGLNEKYTFENFVIGSSNQYAATAAISTSENPGHIFNPLFIYGNSGLGKTHLMCAIGNRIKDEHPEMNIIYVPTENFTNEFVECIKTNKMDEFRKKYRKADVLLVDDVQFLINREGFQEEFFHTFNDLYALNKQIVLTSDKKPKELVNIEERLITRFSQGLTFDIAVPDYDTRMAILRKKAEGNHNIISDDVLQYIAERIQSNVRELEGALLKVISIAELTHKKIDITLTKYAIEALLPTDGIVKITPDKIMDKVSTFYNVTKEELLGKNRAKPLVVPRQIAMYLCSRLTDMNAGMIGKTFGKDRTTVIHNVQKIAEDIKKDDKMNVDVNYIIRDLQSF